MDAFAPELSEDLSASLYDITPNVEKFFKKDHEIVHIYEPSEISEYLTIGICSHTGFNVNEYGKLFDFIESLPENTKIKLDYTVEDSRFKDAHFWTRNVYKENTHGKSFKLKTITEGRESERFLSDMKLTEELYKDIRYVFENVFNTLWDKKHYLDVNKLDDSVRSLLNEYETISNSNSEHHEKNWRKRKISSQLKEMGYRLDLVKGGPKIRSVGNRKGKNRQKKKLLSLLDNAKDRMEREGGSSYGHYLAKYHEVMFEKQLTEHIKNDKKNHEISFKGVNYIPGEYPPLKHIEVDHLGHDAVYVPVLRMDKKAHIASTTNKFKDAMDKFDQDELPSILLFRKENKHVLGEYI